MEARREAMLQIMDKINPIEFLKRMKCYESRRIIKIMKSRCKVSNSALNVVILYALTRDGVLINNFIEEILVRSWREFWQLPRKEANPSNCNCLVFINNYLLCDNLPSTFELMCEYFDKHYEGEKNHDK